MLKYNVGDKARVRKGAGTMKNAVFSGEMRKYEEKIVTIRKVFDGYYGIEEDIESVIGGWCWFDEMLEPIIFTKEDMVIDKHAYRERSGSVYSWTTGNSRYYNNDLTGKTSNEEDIIEVYEINPTPIWKREEIKEMTIEDIEKLTGCKVKIIKG